MDETLAHFFFQIIAERYGKGSIILTSNKSFGLWGEIFGDSVLATAILDRLLHHSSTVNIKGESYRIKEKKRVGLFRSEILAKKINHWIRDISVPSSGKNCAVFAFYTVEIEIF